MKREISRDRFKIGLVALLASGSALLTFYFHGFLEHDTVFTHFFYVPIILASLWWKKQGLIVPAFFAAILIVGDLSLGPVDFLANDLVRGAIFLLTGFVVATLAEETARAEEALRESEDRYRTLFENMGNGVAVYRAVDDGDDFVFLAYNKAAERIDGIPRSQVVGRRLLDVFPGVKEFGLFDILQRVWRTGNPERHPVAKYQDAKVVGWRENYVYRVPSGEIVAVYSDETERKKAEEALQQAHTALEERVKERTMELEAANNALHAEIAEHTRTEEALRREEERFRTVADFTYDWEYWIGPDNRFLYISPSCERITGYSPEAFYQDADLLVRIAHPEDRSKIEKHFHEETASEEALHFDFRITARDGQERWISHNCQPVFSTDGRRTGRRAGNREITARKQIEESLRESEAKYSSLVEQARDGVFIVQDDVICFVNPAQTQMLGYAETELLGMTLAEVLAPEYRQRWLDEHRRRIQGESLPSVQESRILRKEGIERDVEMSVEAIRYHGRPAIMGIVRDVTERKRMQAEIQRKQKLESIGILAGGIAHDFNNLLTGILGNISLAKLRSGSEPDILNTLDRAERAGLRAKDLSIQLLTFARGGLPVKKAVFLPELLRKRTEFALSGSNVSARFALSKDLWPVFADEAQIGQVINNLIINAKEAMPSGGSIAVGAHNIVADKSRPFLTETRQYVCVSVQDQGPGILEDDLKNIFDPYFTTKEKGRGLGLAVAYSIVTKHGGQIDVQSGQGNGTTFCVYLPAAESCDKEEAAEAMDASPEGARSEQGGKRILVMDDEETVRTVTQEMLSHCGYETEIARDGAQALALYRKAMESGRPFAAVILDVTVPGGMGGGETVKRLLEMDPAARAIVSSGYADDPIMADSARHGFKGVIIKPYDLEELRKAVRRVTG